MLLRPRLIAARNAFRRRELIRRLPFVGMGLAFWVFLYIAMYEVLVHVREVQAIGDVVARQLLGMVFFSLTGFVFLSSLVTAISSFYLSQDLPFLMGLPIRRWSLMSVKTVDTVLNTSWMVAFFLPPVLAAYGVSYGAPLWYYWAALVCMGLFILVVNGLGIAGAHVLVRVFPAKAMRDVLMALGLVLFLAAYFIFRQSVMGGQGAEGTGGGPLEMFEGVMSFRVDSPLLPGYWAAEAVWGGVRFGEGRLFYQFVLLSNAVFFLMVSLFAGVWLYGANLEGIRPRAGARRDRGYYPGGPGWALIYKDALVFVRDTGQWSQLIVIGALTLVYVHNFSALPLEEMAGMVPFIREAVVAVNVVMAGLVLSAVAARFLYPSVSIEGQAFWTIRVSPVKMHRYLWGKFAMGWLPVAGVTIALVYLSNLATGVSGAAMYASVAIVAVLSISISGLGAGLGAVYPKFRFENAASVSMSLGGLVFMLVAFFVVLLTVVIASWPFYVYFKGEGGDVRGAAVLSAGLVLLLNAMALYLPMRAGVKGLEALAGRGG